MKTRLYPIINFINRIDSRILIFIVILLNTFSLKLNENEEEYFVFAKAFINHDWMPGALSIRDVPGTRIILDTVVGWALGFASFEQVAVFGRSLSALLFAFPLAKIFKRLRFSNLEAIFLLQIICVLAHQSYFGKEWIFQSFETKVIAYVFVFYSLYYLIDDSYFLSVLFSGLAVYFHILVGGWYSIILLFYLLLSGLPIKTILRASFTFVAITAPFGIYIATTYLANNPNIIDGVQVSQVYVYFRNPHHLDVISQLHEWGSSAQIGLILSLISCFFCLRLYSENKSSIIGKLSLISILLFAQQFISLSIAIFDKAGVFMKLYPYRTSALSFFLMLIILIIFFKNSNQQYPAFKHPQPVKIPQGNPKTAVLIIMLALTTLSLGYKVFKNTKDSCEIIFPSPERLGRISLYSWIKQNTLSDSVFLDLNKDVRDDLDFIRSTDRDSFSVYKFVPTTNKLIYEWYIRYLEKTRAENDLAYIKELKKKYRIDYVLSKTPLENQDFRLVYRNEWYFLYSS
jgi:hypothetical protein